MGNSFFPSVCMRSFDTGMRAAQSVVQFGLRLHPCTRHQKRQQQSLSGKGAVFSAGSGCCVSHCDDDQQHDHDHYHHQQQRERRSGRQQVSSPREGKRSKISEVQILNAAEAKIRMKNEQNALKLICKKYCSEDCCPQEELLDR